MRRNTFAVSVITVATLTGIVVMSNEQAAEASSLNPMTMADAGMDMNGMNMKNMDMKGMKMEATPVVHRGAGTVKKIDAVSGMVTLAHGPIASLNWPDMTMSFKLKDATLAKGIKAGDAVDFDLIQSGSDYVVTRLQKSGK
jgi:Cu(I)/Ag(I) efflux system periplasmic protein CusF